MYRCQTHFNTANSTNVRKYFDICRHSPVSFSVFFCIPSLTRISFNFSVWLHFFSVTPPTKIIHIFLFGIVYFFNFCSPRSFLFIFVDFLLFAWLDLGWGFNLSTLRLSYYFDGCYELYAFSFLFLFVERIYLLPKTIATVQIGRLTILENSSSWIRNIDCPFTLLQQKIVFYTFDRDKSSIHSCQKWFSYQNTEHGTGQRQNAKKKKTIFIHFCLVSCFIIKIERVEIIKLLKRATLSTLKKWKRSTCSSAYNWKFKRKASSLFTIAPNEYWSQEMPHFEYQMDLHEWLRCVASQILRCKLRSATWKYNI